MRELHKNAYGTDANLDPDALIRDVERAQKVSPRACTFGCLESGKEAALVYLKTWWEEQPEIGLVGGFCIAGDYRGCGLSGQILGQAISVYRALGKRELCARVARKTCVHRVFIINSVFCSAASTAMRTDCIIRW